jgi:hypothetical protein
VVESTRDSLLNDKSMMSRSLVLVEDRKFSHTPCEFSAGSGNSGMARITVRLSPLNLSKQITWAGTCRFWAFEKLERKCTMPSCILFSTYDAYLLYRFFSSIQCNPMRILPNPATMDIYTSSIHGEVLLLLTILVETFGYLIRRNATSSH